MACAVAGPVLLPVHPGAVLQHILVLRGVVAMAGARKADRGHALRVALEGVSLGQQRCAQIGRRQRSRRLAARQIVLAVVVDALIRAGEECQIVRLARMLLGVHVRKRHAAVRAQQNMVDVGRRPSSR